MTQLSVGFTTLPILGTKIHSTFCREMVGQSSKSDCGFSVTDLDVTNFTIVQFLAVTLSVIAGFVCVRTAVDGVRRRCAKLSVLVVGAGPIGLTAALIAGRSGRVSKLILYEASTRYTLVNRKNQVAFDSRSISFLNRFGVDFDNLEGCWSDGCFFTRVGVYQEYLLTVLTQLPTPVNLCLNTKFTRDVLKTWESQHSRLLVIVCDGTNSLAANILGLGDIFNQHSCETYGAVAVVDRKDRPLIPVPESRIHGLNFDMSAYGMDTASANGQPGFHLKIFGSPRTRYMALCVPKCDTKLVKALRAILDRSMMRNIFQKCFNTYRSVEDSGLSEHFALKYMKYSPRLFEIRLSQREEAVAYYEDCDMFVIAEGDSARNFNFHMGMDINIGLRGVESLPTFINMAALSNCEHTISKALQFKANHANKICKDILQICLQEYMFT